MILEHSHLPPFMTIQSEKTSFILRYNFRNLLHLFNGFAIYLFNRLSTFKISLALHSGSLGHCKMCSNVSLPSLYIAQLKSGEYLSLKLAFRSKTQSLALKIILAV